jgi:16S rRNA (adenine1518-N6/adenine1519-N6)-dimethyltransferase
MKLSEMRQILEERGIQLTKSLGQNFLHDANQLRRIVGLAELSSQDKVLEIGPGLGPLTCLLAETAGTVLAVEKDARLVPIVKERCHAQVIHEDAVDFLRRPGGDWREWKLVSNLPYSVGSVILVDLALHPKGPERMVVTLQSEVVRRLVAEPGGKDYGILTLLVRLNYEPRGSFRIPPGCFFPEPDVESACVSLVRRRAPLLDFEGAHVYVRLVKRAFSQRRKQMAKLLKQEWPAVRIVEVLKTLGLPLDVRAEALSPEQFIALTRALSAPS